MRTAMNLSKRWKLAALLFPTIGHVVSGAMPVIRSATSTWSVADSTTISHSIVWRQAETFRHDYFLTWDGLAAVDLSNTNIVILWDVVNATNVTETWISTTGLVVNGTSGHIRISLTPAESNISNIWYFGFVRAVELDGTNIINMGVAVHQTIEVRYSPDARYTTYHGPLTYSIATKRLPPFIVEEKTGDYSVVAADVGKTLVMISPQPATFFLPTVTETDAGLWYTFVKRCAASVTIRAGPADSISDSRMHGCVYNDRGAESYAAITVQYLGRGKWIILSFDGTWTTE